MANKKIESDILMENNKKEEEDADIEYSVILLKHKDGTVSFYSGEAGETDFSDLSLQDMYIFVNEILYQIMEMRIFNSFNNAVEENIEEIDE